MLSGWAHTHVAGAGVTVRFYVAVNGWARLSVLHVHAAADADAAAAACPQVGCDVEWLGSHEAAQKEWVNRYYGEYFGECPMQSSHIELCR
jgi:hypothetical protein